MPHLNVITPDPSARENLFGEPPKNAALDIFSHNISDAASGPSTPKAMDKTSSMWPFA